MSREGWSRFFGVAQKPVATFDTQTAARRANAGHLPPADAGSSPDPKRTGRGTNIEFGDAQNLPATRSGAARGGARIPVLLHGET